MRLIVQGDFFFLSFTTHFLTDVGANYSPKNRFDLGHQWKTFALILRNEFIFITSPFTLELVPFLSESKPFCYIRAFLCFVPCSSALFCFSESLSVPSRHPPKSLVSVSSSFTSLSSISDLASISTFRPPSLLYQTHVPTLRPDVPT